MARIEWKPSNLLYPLPAVLVTCRSPEGKDNIMTAAWTGTVSSDPVMVSVSIRKERLSYDYIHRSGCYALNVTTEELAFATDYCGVRSGRKEDKFKTLRLETDEAAHINCPMLKASPVSLECLVKEERDLGSHTMFIAEVAAVHIEDEYLDEDGRFRFNISRPIVYSHGEYHTLGKRIGKFGWSVKKNQKKTSKDRPRKQKRQKE